MPDFDKGDSVTVSDKTDTSTETKESNLYASELYSGESSGQGTDQNMYSFESGSNQCSCELYKQEFDSDKSNQADQKIQGHLDKVNSNGEPVGDCPNVAESYYLKESEAYYETGLRDTVDWKSFAVNSDESGFDKDYPVTTETLQPGDVIVRYGSERGRYATLPGTDFSELSLPYDPNTIEYHEYRVVKPISCESGKAAKNFDQKGLGQQQLFADTFSDMIRNETIVRIENGK